MDPAKLAAFAELLRSERTELIRRRYENLDAAEYGAVYVIPGTKYTKVDVVPAWNRSGRYMIDAAGNIYGIKGYGVIHRGHWYGTLDTIHAYYWGEYTGFKK